MTISAATARRVAVGAQGLAGGRPAGRVDRRHLRKVFARVGVVQIDSVNVLVRSQELPLWARLGPHPRSLIPDATVAGELFEYWAHVATHIPVEHHRLFRWRMAAMESQWPAIARINREHPGFVEEIYNRVRDGGPLVASDLSTRTGRKGPWWDWDDAKMALEYLFDVGRITATRRTNDFARLYDLTERVVPPWALEAPTPDSEAEGRKELLVLAARSMGVATFDDLTDYYRMRKLECRSLMPELVEEGRLLPAEVDGWDKPAYMHPDAMFPRSSGASALLSPFDSLVWFRERTERLFGFRYRIEIYTPPPKRVYGYYVLPFLLGDRLVARVDLKAERARAVLAVRGAFAEPGIDVAETAEALAGELQLMAGWLGLDTIEVSENGDLAQSLRTLPAMKPAS
ncbi:MAG: winged helix DNA-binding domain-containing protein [Actinomycetota bacterium]|nr:winged helix DNA-binding domain-containing protein [Actinomycetota bacterium]